MSQEGSPFENKSLGVAVRFEFPGEDCECDHWIDEPHEEGCPALDDTVQEGCAANDVFIVEGGQERYGEQGRLGDLPPRVGRGRFALAEASDIRGLVPPSLSHGHGAISALVSALQATFEGFNDVCQRYLHRPNSGSTLPLALDDLCFRPGCRVYRAAWASPHRNIGP